MTHHAAGNGSPGPPVADGDEATEFIVRAVQGEEGWEVQIVSPAGEVLWTRACADQAEARTFASTVQQHIYWLSAAKFRQYYRLDAPADTG